MVVVFFGFSFDVNNVTTVTIDEPIQMLFLNVCSKMCSKGAVSKLSSRVQMLMGMILDKLTSPSFVGV